MTGTTKIKKQQILLSSKLVKLNRHFLLQIRPKISSVISDLFSPSANDDVDDSCDRSKALDPMADPIWMKIHEIETTPALGMTWSKATTQDQLMKILKIDPRNIVRIIFVHFC